MILSSVGRLFIYGFTCASLPVLRRKQANARAFRLPGGNLFAAVGVVFMLVLASRVNASEGILLFVTVAIAFVNWLRARTRPAG